MLNVRLYDTYGCTIVATALLQSLREVFPDQEINAYTKNPDLLLGFGEVDNIYDANYYKLSTYDVDLTDYLETRRPLQSRPFRHLYQHMLEIAIEDLGGRLPRKLKSSFLPKVNLTVPELKTAEVIAKRLSQGKPLIWLQTKTRRTEKDWDPDKWGALKNSLSIKYSTVDLSTGQFSKRQAIGITRYCTAGITLDSFLLHGSKAIGAKNTIALLVSSPPEVVTYPDQISLYNLRAGIGPDDVLRELEKLPL